MKKLATFGLLSIMATSMANAAPVAMPNNGGDGFKFNNMYMGGRVALNMLSWTNEYDYGGDPLALAASSKDEFSFETIFGGNIYAGAEFNAFDITFRGEIEGGMLGQFTDKGQGFEFKMTVPYLIANAYYDFTDGWLRDGWYAGAGLGIALPKTELDNAFFADGDRSERGISPMFALMFGWSYDLNEQFALDLRYRLATFMGTEHKRMFTDGYMMTNDIGWIWENSFALGIRYKF